MIAEAVAMALAALPVPECPIDRAVYRLNGAPEYTAGFAPQERRHAAGSDLVFWLATPKRTYWFSLGSPNGYGGTYISPALDPRESVKLGDDDLDAALDALETDEPVSVELDAFAADLKAFETPPQSDNPAPALIFARGLGPALWYNPVGLAGGDKDAEQESMPIGLFQPAGCQGPPPG